jgi:RNA polymerase sigma factor (sigma-70 family)
LRAAIDGDRIISPAILAMSTEPNDDTAPRRLTREELEALVARHLGALRHYVRLQTGPTLRAREPIPDIVQSTVREFVESADDFLYSGDVAFRSYLYTLATNKIVSKHRYHQAKRRSPEREELVSRALWNLPNATDSQLSPSPSRHAERNEDLERLQRAFATLDEEDRRILTMRRIFDIPTADIARELGLAESTVRWRLARIQTQLAQRMGPSAPPPSRCG